MKTQNPVLKAIVAAGSVSELAARCGVRYQAVQRWRNRGLVPAERVLQVEKATGGRVSRYELRPDLYPQEVAESSQGAAQ